MIYVLFRPEDAWIGLKTLVYIYANLKKPNGLHSADKKE